MEHKIDSFNWKNISYNTAATAATINGLYYFLLYFLLVEDSYYVILTKNG